MYRVTYRWKGFPKMHTAFVSAKCADNAITALVAQWGTTGQIVVEHVGPAEEGLVIVVA